MASPYQARHAIFVRENAKRATPKRNEIPEVLATRLLSIRAYDAEGMMLDADVVQGGEAAPVIHRMLADPRIAFLHAHNAKGGCFAARIDRARTSVLSITRDEPEPQPRCARDSPDTRRAKALSCFRDERAGTA